MEKSAKSVKSNTKIDTAFHIFLQAYPNYTLKKIKSELSWRQFQNLVNEWDENPPLYFILRGLVEGIAGKSIGSKKGKKISPDTILARLRAVGEDVVMRKKK